MGLHKFVKEAGEKIAAEKKAEVASKDNAFETMINGALVKQLDKYGLEVANPYISYSNGEVTITGEAADAATREKVVLAIGNVNGVASVDDQMTIVASEEAEGGEPVFHTVVRGDTLGKISKQYLGNAMRYPEIFEANKPMLKDPNLIYPGQVLRIPAE